MKHMFSGTDLRPGITPGTYDESDLLPLSGLQHLLFCERQCALIHVERTWRENFLTAEGRLLHERTDSGHAETRGDVRIARRVPLRSLKLGLAGQADVVELRRVGSTPEMIDDAVMFKHMEGRWRLVPVEYKRGKPKFIDCDRVQLCAQALCLEEMLNVKIPTARLFYGTPRRRFDVALDEALRRRTRDAAVRFHEIVARSVTPVVERQPKCRNCSLLEVCLPPSRRQRRSVAAYVQRVVFEHTGDSCASI